MRKNNLAARSRETAKRICLITRQQNMDIVTIALGRMGFTEDQFRKFREVFLETEKDFCTEAITDGNADKSMEYAKDLIDRCIKQYVPKEMFVPYNQRYDF